MKLFLVKVIGFTIALFIPFFILFLFADGYTDPFYLRFTTPKQDNLILGTSRSAQGLCPQIFDSILQKKFYNYSFTLANSPYGSAYLSSIKKKINLNTKKTSIFIVAVDPWSISADSKNPDDETLFLESEKFIKKTKYVDKNPNLAYLIREFQFHYFDVALNKNKSTFLHNDGWLEINVSIDSAAFNRRVNNKEKEYLKLLSKLTLSNTRLNYLIKTIEFLKQNGKVYLVRLPIHEKIFKIENTFMPTFDSIISPVIQKSNGYLNLTDKNSSFKYTDGNHIWKESAKDVSLIIAKWISEK